MSNKPLYQQIYEHYLKQIEHGILKEGDQLPTEREITKEFSVSRITAKKAINMLSDQNYVERIPGKGSFVKDLSNKDVERNKSKLIGVLLCDIDFSFGLELLKSLEFNINKLGYKMVFKRTYESREKEVDSIREFMDLGVEGIIIQTVHGELYNDEILRVYLSGFPMVFVDRYMDKMNIPFVSSENRNSSYRMTKKLIESNYKHIVFVSANPEGTTTLEQRTEGFLAAETEGVVLETLNLETPLNTIKTEESIKKDLAKVISLIKSNDNIDCLFASEIYVARLINDAIKELGLEMPKDISLVTFDNDTESSKHAYYTHIKQDETTIGEEAVLILNKIILNEDKNINKRMFIDTKIFSGKTTREIKERG